MVQNNPTQPFYWRGLVSKVNFQVAQAIVHEVITDMDFGPGIFAVPTFPEGLFRELDGGARDLEFVRARALADSFNDVAVAIARRKLHLRISACGILAQQRLDQADALEKISPVKRRK